MIPHHPPGEPAAPAGRDCASGKGKAFPTPQHHCAASSQPESALNPSQTAAQNSKQELEQHFTIFLYPLVLYLSESKTTSPKGFHPQTSQWKLCELWVSLRLIVSSDIGRNRQNSPLSIAGHGKSAGNWVSLSRNAQNQLCHPKL